MSRVKTNEIIVAEYSVRNKAFNVTTFADAIRHNKETAEKGLLSDFIVIGAFETYDEAEEACHQMQLRQDAFEEEFGFAINMEDDDVYDQEDELYGY